MNKGELTNEIVEIFIKIQWKIQEENRKKRRILSSLKNSIFLNFIAMKKGCVFVFASSCSQYWIIYFATLKWAFNSKRRKKCYKAFLKN